MADSAGESDSSSVADGPTMQPPSMPPSPITREQWQKRIDSLQQQNRVLKAELETFKLRVKSLQEENRALRQASVNIVSKNIGRQRLFFNFPILIFSLDHSFLIVVAVFTSILEYSSS